MIFITIILGLILSIIGTVLRLIPSTHAQYLSFIRYIFLVFPPFALGDSLNGLALIDSLSFSELPPGETYSPTDMNIAGAGLVFLAWESVLYICLAISFEYITTLPTTQARLSRAAIPAHHAEDALMLKDEDVIAEEERVASGAADENSTILVKDLKKVFPGGKFAVRGVSLGIPNGECFGLLGINGAGTAFLSWLVFNYNCFLTARQVDHALYAQR